MLLNLIVCSLQTKMIIRSFEFKTLLWKSFWQMAGKVFTTLWRPTSIQTVQEHKNDPVFSLKLWRFHLFLEDLEPMSPTVKQVLLQVLSIKLHQVTKEPSAEDLAVCQILSAVVASFMVKNINLSAEVNGWWRNWHFLHLQKNILW